MDTSFEETVPASVFTLFPRLPAEIQIEIWKSVDSNSNIVMIKKANTYTTEQVNGRSKTFTNYQARARYTVPALLHTCYDSRRIALQTYQPRFAKQLGQPIYFDFLKDMINMEDCEALASFLKVPWFANLELDMEEVNQIHFVAISGEWVAYQDRVLQRLHRFQGLESLYFERASSEKSALMTHFEWGLRMKFQNWRTWMTGSDVGVDIPKIQFLEAKRFCEVTEGQDH